MNATNSATSYSYLLIGSGRVARHLGHYFNLLNIPFETWDRSQDPHDLQRKVLRATHVLLAISDAALEGFRRQHLAGMDVHVVHFSGALNIEEAISAHPLMTFTHDLYELADYEKIHFVLTGKETLAEALPGLSNKFSILPPESKALYHAYCVVGGNFTTLLINEMLTGFAQLKIPPEAAQPYLEKVFINTTRNPLSALTGPLARRDVVTVEKNLNALTPSKSANLYRAFLENYWPDYPGK